MREQRIWLAYANTNKFNAIRCFRVLGHSFWKMNKRKFQVGDIVYLYVSSEERVMYKTKVKAIDLFQESWDDDSYWSDKERNKARGKRRMLLVLTGEYQGNELNEVRLREYGLPEKKSPLEQPVYKAYIDCIRYIDDCFNHQQ